MKKRRLILMLVLAMALSSLLAACGGNKGDNNGASNADPTPSATNSNAGASQNADTGSDNAEPQQEEIQGTVTMATHRTDAVENGTFDRYIAKFNEKYPNVEVKIEGLKDYGQTIQVRIAANEAPDVLSPPDTILKKDYPSLFEPINEYQGKFSRDLEEVGTYEGNLYAIPSGTSANGLIYNKAAFAKAGIDGPPKTLDELFADAKKLKDAGIVPVATNFKDGWTLADYLNIVNFISGSNNYRNYFYESDPPFAIDGPVGQSLGILKRLIDEKLVEPDIYSTNWEGTIIDLATGKAGMMFIGQWLLPQMETTGGGDPKDFGFVPFPYDNSGVYKSMISSDFKWAINKTSKNIPAAKAWLQFLLEESTYADDSGLIPTLDGQKSTIAHLAEFMSKNPEMIGMGPDGQDTLATEKEMQFDRIKFLQEAVTSDSMEAVFKDFSKRYTDAKKKLAK